MAKDALVRRYLLGTLPEDERHRVEDQYFSKPERFEELVAAENDLIDSYVRRELSSSEARQFESSYLSSPERRARVEFARSLERASSEFAPRQSQRESAARRLISNLFSARFPALQWTAAAAAVLLAVSVIWLIVQKRVARTDLPVAQSRRQATPPIGIKPGEPQAQGPATAEQPLTASNGLPNAEIAVAAPSEHLLTVTLNSGAVRGAAAGGNQLTMTSEVSSVIFRLPIPNLYHSKYQAELQTIDEQTIQSSKDLTGRESNGQVVVYSRVPAARLTPGDYIVRLSGKDGTGRPEEVQAYSLRVRVK